MQTLIQPDSEIKHYLEKKSESDFKYCFACKSCVTECPVNSFTGKLNLLKIIRLACFGQVEALLESSEIWYCINCHRCSNVCPMKVRGDSLIQFLKSEAVKRGIDSVDFKNALARLYDDLKIVRLNLLYACFNGEDIKCELTDWEYIKALSFKNRFEFNRTPVFIKEGREVISSYEGIPLNTMSCLTCRECSSACPVLIPSFDPLFIFRSVALGLKEELVRHPAIWLCIGCETCTETCAQGVKGHLLIKQLQRYAIDSGIVDKDFLKRWNEIQKEIFDIFLSKVDSLLSKNLLH